MKIESIIKRDGGTKVVLGETEYHFIPGDDGRHVCSVEDEAHVDRLLSISEGYRCAEVATESQSDVPAASDTVAGKKGRKQKPETTETAPGADVPAASDTVI